MKEKTMNTALIAGLLSGIAGLLVFLTIHHFWIKPIWFILPPGLVIAALGGLAVGWSYAEIQAGLPPRPWTSLAVFVLVGATLTPAVVLAQLRPPPLNISTGAIIDGSSTGVVIARVVIELLLTATVVGGLAGWWLGHTGRAAFATALAGFVFALGPGHNIPLLGNTPAVGKGVVLLIIIIFVSAIVLVESQAWLARR
ncbi:MAG TPA: hypothetical protein VJL59_04555 [Anaerolineales bacterium]|nr:hypothetical protein [Anaerolineales bacterium]